MVRHFLDIKDIELTDLREIITKSGFLKSVGRNGNSNLMLNKYLALIFEKPSTRTRVSFEVGMGQLGGKTVVITGNDSQLGRGETIADTARVLSRYVDIIMLRTYSHDSLLEMASNSSVPVINGLTDASHPCQVMADIMTFEEKVGPIENKIVAWCGDANNMVNSWMQASLKFNFEFRLSCPDSLKPETLPANVKYFSSPQESVAGANLVTTDTWVSMGDDKAEEKKQLLAPYQINDELMARASSDAIFMHCLPAHRGEEVTDSVMDGESSVVFDEAENRLHIQKGIILWCLDAA